MKPTRWFWSIALVAVLAACVALWWVKLHRPWLAERRFMNMDEGLRSVETVPVLPAFLQTKLGTEYFDRIQVFRTESETDGIYRHLPRLHWCVFHYMGEGSANVEFEHCPRLETVHLVNVSSLRLHRCPELKELHLVRCPDINIDGLPPGVKVLRDGKPSGESTP